MLFRQFLEAFGEFTGDAGAQHDLTLLLVFGRFALGVVAKPDHLKPAGSVRGVELRWQFLLGNVLRFPEAARSARIHGNALSR